MVALILVFFVCSILGAGVPLAIMHAIILAFYLVLIAGAIGLVIPKTPTDDWRCSEIRSFAAEHPALCP